MRPYATSFFLAGMGSALELMPSPTVFPVSRLFGPLSDAQLLASDWERVGMALYSVMGTLEAEQGHEQTAETAEGIEQT